jgi:hypothetical protein
MFKQVYCHAPSGTQSDNYVAILFAPLQLCMKEGLPFKGVSNKADSPNPLTFPVSG